MRLPKRVLLSLILTLSIALVTVALPGTSVSAAPLASGDYIHIVGVYNIDYCGQYGFAYVHVIYNMSHASGGNVETEAITLSYGAANVTGWAQTDTSPFPYNPVPPAAPYDGTYGYFLPTLPAHTLITLTMTVTGGGNTDTSTYGPFDCTTGAPPPIPPPSPHVPGNFILRQITCTTGLNWAADPKATVNGSDHLTAGQIWYVSPTAVKGTDGKQWTPVYIGSWDIVYIPTACAFQTQTVVNAAPPVVSGGGGGYGGFRSGFSQ